MVEPPVAVITGASRGLGEALARALAERGWALVLDARGADALSAVEASLPQAVAVRAIPGDITDAGHRAALVAAARDLGPVTALVNNASLLGPSPLPALADHPLDAFAQVMTTNVTAPLALTQLLLADLRAHHGCVVNITSDAAVEAYQGWGGYGASKAALEQLTNVLAAEEGDVRVYRVDPGDMRTQMHQEAFPGEDISDRPLPDAAVPGLLALIAGQLPSGRYRAQTMTADARSADAEEAR